MNKLDQITLRIIKEQELIVGPIAWQEAGKVKGINIRSGEVHIEDGDSRLVVDRLVSKYENIFGRASREVCREAAAPLVADLSPSEVPSSLQ